MDYHGLMIASLIAVGDCCWFFPMVKSGKIKCSYAIIFLIGMASSAVVILMSIFLANN